MSNGFKCPNCNFEDHIDDALYCQECGIYLINICENDMCDFNNGDAVPLPYDAKFCPICGCESSFKSFGYFDK